MKKKSSIKEILTILFLFILFKKKKIDPNSSLLKI